MSKKASNLSGHWSGEFSYPRHEGPTTPFLANIKDENGLLSGTIIEPDIVSGTPTIEAHILGCRNGSSIDFIKSYGPPAPWGYENPVDYVGSISSDGNTIRGVWHLLEFDGSFEMRREVAVTAEAGEEVEAALPPLVTHPAR